MRWIYFLEGPSDRFYYMDAPFMDRDQFEEEYLCTSHATVRDLLTGRTAVLDGDDLNDIDQQDIPAYTFNKAKIDNNHLQALALELQIEGSAFTLEEVQERSNSKQNSGWIAEDPWFQPGIRHDHTTHASGHNHGYTYDDSYLNHKPDCNCNSCNPQVKQTSNPIKTESKTDNMKGLMQGMNLNFGKFNSDKLALSFAGLAVKNKAGNYVVYNKENKTLIEVGDLKFDVEFYQIPIQTLAAGDVTLIDDQIFIVDSIREDGSIRCINPSTGSVSNKLKRTNLFNMYFYTKIINMFEMFQPGAQTPGAAGQAGTPFGNINPMMLMMMSGKDGGGSMDSMMEMMMMSQVFGGGAGANPFVAFGAQPTQQ